MPDPDCAAQPCAAARGPSTSVSQFPGRKPAPWTAAALRLQWPATRPEDIQACGGIWATGDGNIAGKIFQTPRNRHAFRRSMKSDVCQDFLFQVHSRASNPLVWLANY